MFTNLPLLSLLIWLPIFGGIAVLLNGDNAKTRPLSLLVSLVTLLLSIGLYIGFDSATHQMQFAEHASWITSFNINYALGVDGLSGGHS